MCASDAELEMSLPYLICCFAGKAVLRLKIDMTSPNPTLWDPVAYRIKLTPHPMTKDAWCIYPSYDFSHGLIDSLEDIDYSLCTLEFEVRGRVCP
jgi:glutaminyl-tRNA synthetase